MAATSTIKLHLKVLLHQHTNSYLIEEIFLVFNPDFSIESKYKISYLSYNYILTHQTISYHCQSRQEVYSGSGLKSPDPSQYQLTNCKVLVIIVMIIMCIVLTFPFVHCSPHSSLSLAPVSHQIVFHSDN